MIFYLGTHMPHWLRYLDVPLFVSRIRLKRYKKLFRAKGIWALDSGGFSELNKCGQWTVTPREYADEIRKYSEHIGNLQWAACQDWMCESFVLNKTHKTIEEHQRLTIENFLTLSSFDLPTRVIPVLQGWEKDDYMRHIDDYAKAGVDLSKEYTVGVGSVCRRQHTEEAEDIISAIHDTGIKIHGFGFKVLGLIKSKDKMFSSDSLAWSFCARRDDKLPECTGHENCANCLKYAVKWRENLLQKIQFDDNYICNTKV